MKQFFLLLQCLILAVSFSCCSKEIVHEQDGRRSPIQQKIRENKISPGHCRIIGTIVSIDSSLDKGSRKDPCSMKPCNAEVRVDSIIGYGSSFPPLLTGRVIRIHFYFTLSATTKELFPNLREFYPGLQVGSSFLGDVEVLHQMNESDSTMRYAIYGYRRK